MIDEHSAWNPGLESDIPPAYRKLETIYRPENVTTRLEDVRELAAQTGMKPQELVAYKPERLVLHELIVRITADILVVEGDDEIELGKRFRRIARHILSHYIEPRMSEITHTHRELRATARDCIRRELIETLYTTSAPEPERKRFFLFAGRKRKPSQPAQRETIFERERRAIAAFKAKGLVSEDRLGKVIYRSLYRILGCIAGNRGFLGPDPDFLTALVCNHVCNSHGSEIIGQTIAPWIAEAIEKEGYTSVQAVSKPLLISLKGASAAGKSSLRPKLKEIMSDQGMVAEGYSTISPDIWRRLLLDYEALGEAYKYAGRLTSHEVITIDGKLDHYIRAKAERQGSIPHMLVDRFRFDSFSTESIAKVLHGTYVKHVDTMYMYFVVTPPDATVTRGWERGLKTGRYKAVEDYLDHSVEAYAGMPKILFKWLAYDRPLFKYEFLDNSVPKGTFPKTIAFGTQKEINILDCSGLVAIERYQKIRINAKSESDLYPADPASSARNNLGFLRQCIRKIPTVNFIDRTTGTTYIRVSRGKFNVLDDGILAEQLKDNERAQIFVELAPDLCRDASGSV